MFDFEDKKTYNFNKLGVIIMKWTIAQLKKKIHQDPTFEATVDLTEFMPKDEDLIAVAPTTVKGKIDIEDDTYFHFDLNIQTTLTIACARTLEPVEFSVDVEVRETFTDDEDDEYRQIDGISIDLSPIVWSNIYLEKPMRVLHPEAKEDDSFEESEESKRKGHPQLQELEKFKS